MQRYAPLEFLIVPCLHASHNTYPSLRHTVLAVSVAGSSVGIHYLRSTSQNDTDNFSNDFDFH